ncbi:hypothetical protein OGAPHI_001621 [Ogataea philodendri]|uniref:Uncharacterized protein n=1 Tax=Ogataea philodendri TaxID=1378263 RepID=A0A9P8T8R4_9ASCO|nr:uncharacterized protein OGAPHI_001621 [Ogataea philodendri]KAH3669500.1 hypothetical protein OGAPHI_001621 [Ogataea philodendri]
MDSQRLSDTSGHAHLLFAYLSNKLNNTSSSTDLLLGQLRNVSSLHNDWNFWQSSLTQNLSVSRGQGVDDNSGIFGARSDLLVLLLNQRPQLVKVDDWAPEVGLLLVEISHTNFTKVTWVVFVQVGSVVVLTTGHTSTTGMLSVLSNTTLTGRHGRVLEDDSNTERDGSKAHHRDGAQQHWFAAESVEEQRRDERNDHVSGADETVDQDSVCREQSCEDFHSVEHDRIDSGKLLANHREGGHYTRVGVVSIAQVSVEREVLQ